MVINVRVVALLTAAMVFAVQAVASDPFPSTYELRPADALLIRGASAYTGTGDTLERIDVRVRDGRIDAIGQDLEAVGARVIDAHGRWLTPGIIDVHSHLGDYPSPAVQSTSDGNEATSPNTAQVWAEHSVWPQDPQFAKALANRVFDNVTSLIFNRILRAFTGLIGHFTRKTPVFLVLTLRLTRSCSARTGGLLLALRLLRLPLHFGHVRTP